MGWLLTHRLKDASGVALAPDLSLDQLSRKSESMDTIVLTPSRKPSEHEREKLEIEQHLSTLPDPQYDKPGGE